MQPMKRNETGRGWVVTAAVALATATCAAGPPDVATYRLPAGGVSPQAVVSDGHRVDLIYVSGDPRHGNVFLTRSDDDGHTFASPRRVNSTADSVVVIGSVRGPQLAVGRDGRVHVTWTGPAQARSAGLAMNYARSGASPVDHSVEFEPQRDVTRGHPGMDGGGSVAADAEGNVYVAWHAPGDGGRGEADRQVWLARSQDDGATFAAESAIGPARLGACGCCALRVAAGDAGQVDLLYRSATDTTRCDMYTLTSADHGATFGVAWSDPWQANACVMSTATVVRSGPLMLAAWETRGHIYVRSADGRSSAAGRVKASAGRPAVCKHPALAVNGNGEFVVAWAEGTGWNRGGTVAWQAFTSQGLPIAGRSGTAPGLPAWDAPALFVTADGHFTIAY